MTKTNTWAILALIFGIIIPPLGIIFALIAFSNLKKTGEEGKGLAIAGLVIGIVLTLPAILLILGGIVFFGVLNPTAMVPSNCQISAPFDCPDAMLNNGLAKISIINNGGQTYMGAKMTVTDYTTDQIYPCTETYDNWNNGEQKVFNCKVNLGDNFRGNIDLKYYSEGSSVTFTKTANGEVVFT